MTEYRYPYSKAALDNICVEDHTDITLFAEEIAYAFGVPVTMQYNNVEDEMCFHLNTGAKSELTLVDSDRLSSVFLKKRYDPQIMKNFSLLDILNEVKSCMYGREYISDEWLNAMEHYGIIKVERTVVKNIIF